VDFLHGMAVWDASETARAAVRLLDAAKRGELWLDPDELRDGTVLARLAVGDRKGAQSAFQGLLRASTRDPTDLRTRLLWSYIEDTTAPRAAFASLR
jgi:hypothetical protein